MAEDNIIYFDHAATTAPDKGVISLYEEVTTKYYANPASAHILGVKNNRLLDKARLDILNALKMKNHSVIFTSGATESNNLALKGYMERYKGRGKHLIISAIEHPSIINTANHLALLGYEVSIVPVRSDGKIYLEDIQKEMKPNTILVSIMAINNETGIKQPINEIASFLKEFPYVAFHVDAVQAVGKMDINYNDIDLLTISMHKLGGLKGTGLLIRRNNIELIPILDGGGHEQGFRSGTNDLANALSDAYILKKTLDNKDQYLNAVHPLAEKLYLYFINHKDEVIINSNLENPYIINISLLNKKASVFAEFLSNNGIMISTHSACSSRLDTGSPTLEAMGKSNQISKNSIRISLSHLNNINEVERFIQVFDVGLKRIRG